MRKYIAILAGVIILVAIFCKSTTTVGEKAEADEVIQTPGPTQEIIITAAPEPKKFQEIHSMDWDADESYLLAKMAMAEAEGESIEGKAMVIMVILNRVWAEGFPSDIEEVIFAQNKGTYQFSPVAPGGRWWTTEPNEDCWIALNLIMEGQWDESEGATYFEATYNGSNTWHSRNLEYIKTVGNHNFYKQWEE